MSKKTKGKLPPAQRQGQAGAPKTKVLSVNLYPTNTATTGPWG